LFFSLRTTVRQVVTRIKADVDGLLFRPTAFEGLDGLAPEPPLLL